MRNSFSSSTEVFEWLSRFINLEKGQKPKSFRIDRMETLSELAGNPHLCAPSIHIAGSKGKGSVTSMLAAMLTAAGFLTARYMSPHVSDFRERLCLDGSFFSEDIYRLAADELRLITEESLPAALKQESPSHEKLRALFDPSTAEGSEPTYWELLTLYFFLCSRLSKCDVMVVETGLGGRLDSTNIVDPLVSVITLIEIEHTNFLGNTIAEIAAEKAGIIKKGKPVVLARQSGEALRVFQNKARGSGSALFYMPEISRLTDINVTSQKTDFSLLIDYSSVQDSQSPFPARRFSSLTIPIPGKVQAENAALAAAAVKTAFPKIGDEAIRNGLLNVKIPARFENISANTPRQELPFIIDGAHTPESLSLCVQTFRSLYGDGGVLIFGCAADKDYVAMAKAASMFFSKIFITAAGTFKTSNPENIYEVFSREAGEEKVSLIKDTKEAVKQAELFAEEKKLPVLAAGSFYLAAEIRSVKLPPL